MSRAALYWAPALNDPLHALGSAWLGRDTETGATLAQPAAVTAEQTAEARRYGLHATLKPPFAFAAEWQELRAAAMALAASTRPFALPPLRVTLLDGFLALREAAPCPALHALADACIERLDRFRLPPSAEELARRQRHRLSHTQQALLERWGYPYVFGEWRFHVTLSRRLSPEEVAPLQALAQAHLGAAAAQPRFVRELCLFTEVTPGAPFLLAERLPLLG